MFLGNVFIVCGLWGHMNHDPQKQLTFPTSKATALPYRTPSNIVCEKAFGFEFVSCMGPLLNVLRGTVPPSRTQVLFQITVN